MSAAETKAPAAGAASKDGGGSGGKLVLILGLVNVLATLGIAGVLAVSFMREKQETSVTDIAEGEGDAHGASAEGGHGEEKKAEGGHGEEKKAEGGGHGEAAEGGHGAASPWGKTVTLDQFTVNLTSPGSATPKFVRVNISIEVPDAQTEQEVVAKMAQIRNVIIDLFNSKRPSDLATGESRDYLKEEIRNAINGFMVSGKVKGVFFTNFALTT